MKQSELKNILELHQKWLVGEENGVQANLHGADLSGADFCGANLCGADLSGADLRGADFHGANLLGADLNGADLCGADLNSADLCGAILRYANLSNVDLRYVDLRVADLNSADLRNADLRYVDLYGADLQGAGLTNIKYDFTTIGLSLACPEDGSFTGYKVIKNKLIKLLIPEDAKRSSATTQKCRCSKAKVLSITGLDTKDTTDKVVSEYDNKTVYEVGKVVYPDSFDDDRWNECSHGIHFFVNKNDAIMYNN